MVLHLFNIILVVLYILSGLNTLRHAFFLFETIKKNYNKPQVAEDEEEIPDAKYILNDKSLLFLGLSISYLIGGLIMGIVLN